MASSTNEIEGKWLNPVGFEPNIERSYRIRQGYVAQDANGTIVRLRQRDDTYFLTVKGKPVSSGSKPEAETEVSKELFDLLWPFTEGRRVEKTRHIVQIIGHVLLGEVMDLTAEIDVFGGELEGLVMVEVEVPSDKHLEDIRNNPPDWFGQDVTDDMRYGNNWLSANGIPSAA